MIRELHTPEQVRAACGDDDLVMWAAQGLARGSRAWALGAAVVTASPRLARRDRLGVCGDAASAAQLVRHALGELGPSFHPVGDTELIAQVAAEIDGMEVAGEFSWMSLPPGVSPAPGDRAAWLEPADEDEVSALLTESAPGSYAVPGMPGVRRWAGIRIGGRLAAVAADAWSAPDVGLLGGVATAGAFRGRGLAGRLCRWVAWELEKDYGRAALMVDDDNPAALGVYARLGFLRRRIAAAGTKDED
ncbi:GNAT family N-acetyltransferase [Nonomuraea typhae]|uniref:GNAT family N-acetyltransferase n=1 Tax=Nonomuraea typhae TaxID=2603600 RepID=A0ABW7Z6G0_9ACTN